MLSAMPIIAILRGIRPGEVSSVGDALLRAGIRIIEVPMNSPEPLESIRILAERLGDKCVVGAGTVLSTRDVDDVAEMGGRLIVSPNTDTDVIRRSLEKGCIVIPGVATATEAFDAYAQGARYLKLFPASTYGPSHAAALRAVLPEDTHLLAVGGVEPGNIEYWLGAGVDGVGIGSEIYRPGDDAATVSRKATAVVAVVVA